jgi:hypothetical protein
LNETTDFPETARLPSGPKACGQVPDEKVLVTRKERKKRSLICTIFKELKIEEINLQLYFKQSK